MSELLLTAIRQSSPEEKRLAFAELAKELCRISDPDATAVSDFESDFPRPGTPEWGAMNALRQTLIRKKVRGELTADESPLYELLQKQSLHAVEVEFPFRPA